MNFLEKLDFLMKEKNINKSTLSKESGIPYTTIDGLYKKGYDNVKLSTLNKLSDYFDVSIDYLVRDSYSVQQFKLCETGNTNSLKDKVVLEEFIVALKRMGIIKECAKMTDKQIKAMYAIVDIIDVLLNNEDRCN